MRSTKLANELISMIVLEKIRSHGVKKNCYWALKGAKVASGKQKGPPTGQNRKNQLNFSKYDYQVQNLANDEN